MDDLIYFVNSMGKRAVLVSPENKNYWSLGGRSGFLAPEVDVHTQKMASGATWYFGKDLQARQCTLRMICKGKSTAERDRILFDMLDILLDADGVGEGKLYVRKSDGGMAYLNCVYGGGMNAIQQYRKFQKFDLEFTAADPCFYMHRYEIPYDNLDQPFSVVNNSSYNMAFEMIMARLDIYPTLSWYAYGNITNTTTGKNLVFRYASPGLSIDKEYQLVVRLGKSHKEIYLETADHQRVDAGYMFDWSQSDPDFGAVPGTNEFTCTFSGGNRVSKGTFFYFDQICMGV